MKGIALLTMFFLPGTYAAVSLTHTPPSSIGLCLFRSTEAQPKMPDFPGHAAV